MPPMTDKQRSFIATLVETRDVDPAAAATISAQVAANDKDTRWASEVIESLLQRPPKERRPPELNTRLVTLPQVPEGRYAIITEPDGAVKFYKVDQGKVGSRWEGYTFVSIQAGPEEYPIKGFEQKLHILEAIARNPREALERYGQLLGHCGVCGLELTDETSRRIGIGPVCRGAKR